MLESDDIKDEMISGDAGGIGGAMPDGRCRGRLVDRPWSDLRRLEVLASWVPALRGTVSSFGAIVRILMDQLSPRTSLIGALRETTVEIKREENQIE